MWSLCRGMELMDEGGTTATTGIGVDLVDAYILGAYEAVIAVRGFYGVCTECGEDDHDECILFDGPEISREEFSAYALASLLCSAGGF